MITFFIEVEYRSTRTHAKIILAQVVFQDRCNIILAQSEYALTVND